MARTTLLAFALMALAACTADAVKSDTADTGFEGCCYFECSDGSSGYVAAYDGDECADQADLNCVGNGLEVVASDYSDSSC